MTRRDEDGLQYAVTGAEARALDAYAIDQLGMPGRMLMEMAGQGAAQAIRQRTGGVPSRAVVLCGPGNNGGDGYVVARALRDARWDVVCLALGGPGRLSGDAAVNFALYRDLDGATHDCTELSEEAIKDRLSNSPVIVDGLFGTGLSRPLKGQAAALVSAASQSRGSYRVALDIPSGLCASRGTVLGQAFQADVTMTFGAIKSGLCQFPGAEFVGELVSIPIGLPSQALAEVARSVGVLDAKAISKRLPKRSKASHKGTHGRVAVVGGFGATEGAAVLCGVAALRAGAGYATWFADAETGSVLRPPELLKKTWGELNSSDALVVGPGLGQSTESKRALKRGLESPARVCVLDADALNLMAPASATTWPQSAVLTPHPGEAARLLGITTAAVQGDRLAALAALVKATGATVVLKGAGTLIGAPGRRTMILPGGVPALAAAGTGDVLAGVIAAFAAQGLSAYDACLCATWVHAGAGLQLGLGHADRGVLAGELSDAIPAQVDALVQGWTA
ncbi:MAG: NAD(P)H-hydrate dehydratase [Myxococcota bacterium]